MALLLYLATAAAIAFVWRRTVQPVAPAALLVLVCLPLLFTGRALFTGRVYGPIDLAFTAPPLQAYAAEYGVAKPYNSWLSDLHCQIIPWQKGVREALRSGEWPLWNRYILAGTVLAASAQSAVYDPVNLIGMLLPLPQALGFGAAMTFFLAGFFAFAFARETGRSVGASLVAAAVFMFSAMLAFYVAWPLGRAWAWLPLVLFAVFRMLREPRLQSAAILTLALVLVTVAGHPESLLHVVAVGICYGGFELARRWRTSRRDAVHALLLAIGAGVVALLLTAIYLLPFLDAASQSGELVVRRDLYGRAPFGKVFGNELPAQRAGMSLLPFYSGQAWLGATAKGWDPVSARVGGIAWALALAGLIAGRRRGETWFFAALAAIGFAATCGLWPVAHALHALPPFNIALNDRLSIAAAMAVAMLAAIAVDELQSGRLTVGITTAGVLLAATFATFALRSARIAAGSDPSVVRTLIAADLLPLAIAAALLFVRRIDVRIAASALLLLIVAQRMVEDGKIYPALPERAFYPRVGILRWIPDDARFTGAGYTVIANDGAMWGLEDVRGYEAMSLRRFTDTLRIWSIPQFAFFNRVEDLTQPFLSFLNVRYALTTSRQTPEGWHFIAEDAGTRLLQNDRVLPRAFVPRRVRYATDQTTVVEGLKSVTDFADVAYLEVPQHAAQEDPNGPGVVSVRREGSGYELNAEMERAGWVVVSESAWSGWRAYLDDERVETRFANSGFLAVHVPAGLHRLRLVYLPSSFTRGRNVSAATAAFLLLFGLYNRRRRCPPSSST